MHHTVRGGLFPPPPAIASLLAQLPPPHSFKGPFVAIEDLFGILITNPALADSAKPPRPEGIAGANGLRLFDTATRAAVEYQATLNSKSQSAPAKRSIDEDEDADGENSNSGFSHPVNDIYRNRKIKNAKLS